VDQVFAAAGIPLLRVAVKHTYSLQEVQALLQPHITLDANQPLPSDDDDKKSWTTPRCAIRGRDTCRFAPGTLWYNAQPNPVQTRVDVFGVAPIIQNAKSSFHSSHC